MTDKAMTIYEDKEKNLFGEEEMREVERVILLRNVDQKWMDHLEAMDGLMETIGLQAYAQRNPIAEFRLHGADMFDEMVERIQRQIISLLLKIKPRRRRYRYLPRQKPS